MIRLTLLFFLSSTGLYSSAQGSLEEQRLCSDSLLLQCSAEGSIYLQWQIGSNTLLNTVCMVTGSTADLLVSYNPILHFRDIEACDLILVPFDTDLLDSAWIRGAYPIFYQVKHGETLFGIAHRMFQIPVERVQSMNSASNENLKTGQYLLLGYLHADGVMSRQTESSLTHGPLDMRDHDFDNQRLNIAPEKHFTTQKGVAWWNKSKVDPNLFALHRKAPVNSLIEIRNPMFRRSVWAKVIGTIPVTYAEDISVIVSQGVAKSLGAIDGRFYVEVCYEDR